MSKMLLAALLLSGGIAIAATPLAAPHLATDQASSGDEALYKVNIDGTSRVRLLANARVLDLSPGRTKALLVRDSGDGRFRTLVVHDLATGVDTDISTMPYAIDTASWSPDSGTIAVGITNTSQCVPPATRCAFWDTWLVRPDGSGLRQFASHGRWPTWAPGSLRVAFAGRFRASSEEGVLTIAEVKSGRQHALGHMGPITAPTWSRRGGFIAYVAAHGESADAIHVVGADRRVSRRWRPGWDLAWAPSGKTLALVRPTSVSGRYGLVLVDPVKGHPRRIVSAMHLGRPTWSPRGRLIAYASDDPTQTSTGRLSLIRPSGRSRHAVTNEPPGTGLLRIFWAPGGRSLYYVTVGGSG